MPSRKERPNLDPHFRFVYLLQLIAAGAVIAGLFPVWWQGVETYTGLDLLNRTVDRLLERSPTIVAHPLALLWLLAPAILAGGLRGITGLLVTPVAYRRLALILVILALLVLAHFYLNFGEEIPKHSPLKEGRVQSGFWLTGSSTAILGLLILVEGLIKVDKYDPFAAKGPTAPVADAERLWRGDYQSCPYCGMLNEPGAKACYNCRNLLFDFMEDKQDE